MIPAPEFAAYPLSQAPVYARWLTSGVVLMAVASSVSVLLRPFIEVWVMAAGVAMLAVAWTLTLLLRVLYYRFNRHNAQCYGAAVQEVQQAWWARHRQQVALIEAVLLGPGCSAPPHRQRLFDPEHRVLVPEDKGDGPMIRMRQVMGLEVAERERQLAKLLVLQWQQQTPPPADLQPLHCYWLGSPDAWQAFAQQMAISFPQVRLPEQPEAWQGVDSLSAIIERLQGVPTHARILCAGCQSTAPMQDSRLPAGEAAVLWLLAPQGGVRFFRGEWFSPGAQSLAAVAERALQQGGLAAPAPVCVSFSQPDAAGLRDLGWNLRQHVQDAHFGALPCLEGMVAQTLAAWHAEQHGEPCAWLTHDPHHTLALGIVEPNDSNR
jgi:hypothetical protein